MKCSLCCLLICFLGVAPMCASEVTDEAGVEFFEQHIRPLLVAHCIKCHGADQQKSGLRLDSIHGLVAGGEAGSAIERGDAEVSLLLSAVRYDALEMPPSGKLSDREIEAVERWIGMGAPWPNGETISPSETKRQITDEDREHWSFRPIMDSAVPTFESAEDQDWCRNPIDAFVLRGLRDKSISPAPEADRGTLIRRLYLYLLGVPPRPEDVRQFVKDDREDAYERLVDELLARPEFGERWGRHWLDLVRYAESDGFRQDAYREGAWHYRDYVIRSINEDKPYDQFVAEQLAGDELYPDDPTAWVGTHYFRLQPYEYNQRDIVRQRQDILNDITDVTSDVFLGMGMKCARCHDHKFDPILQKDYFRLQSHFAALVPTDDVLLVKDRERLRYERELAKWESETEGIRRKIDEVWRPYLEKQAKAAIVKFTPELQAMYAKPDEERSAIEKQLVYFIARQTREEGKPKLSTKDAKRVKELEAKLDLFSRPEKPKSTLVAKDVGTVAPLTFVSGNLKDKAAALESDEPAIEPSGMEVLRHLVPDVSPVQSSKSTGRRTALAKWLTSPDHPLTSRVAVNRIWQQHFGRGLAATPSDFGKLGTEPSHPELLDWLAKNLVRKGWRQKEIHRLILTSSTYRQSATHPHAADNERQDPRNELVWRARVRRLDAEQIIDSVLSVSGQLDARLGGASQSSSTKRRAVYRKVKRNSPDRMLGLFDGADSFNSTPKRENTTTSTQALALLNGEFGNRNALAMAKLLKSKSSNSEQQIRLAHELAFGRRPEKREIELALAYLGAESEATTQQLADFCHVLLNANEFIYVD